MLETVGFPTLDALIDATVPAAIRSPRPLACRRRPARPRRWRELKAIMGQNRVFRSFIGQGYYGTFTPPVIQRCILENPGWYTAYTPYQAEISQGPARGAVEFPDDDLRPDGARRLQCLLARRSNRRRRGGHALPWRGA